MALWISEKVWKDSKATGNELVLLLALADHANDKRVAWPGTRSLQEKCNITSRDTLYRNLTKLEVTGELIIEPRKGPHGTNLYHVCTGISLSVVDYMRADLGLPTRQELMKNGRKQNLNDGKSKISESMQDPPEQAQGKVEEFVPKQYKVQTCEMVPVCEVSGTGLEVGGTNFEMKGTKVVHKPSLTVIKESSINQFNGKFDFLKFQNQVKSQIPQCEKFLPLFEASKFMGIFSNEENFPVLYLQCSDKRSQEILNSRYRSTCKSVFASMLLNPDCEVIFTNSQQIVFSHEGTMQLENMVSVKGED